MFVIQTTGQPDPAAPEHMTVLNKQPVSLLRSSNQSFGRIVVNLTWNANRTSGLLRFLASQPIDLDLGCMFEHKNGHKGVIQSLGGQFGTYDSGEYIQLQGDDRTGESDAGELLFINGNHWEQFSRILIFAFAYSGTPSWKKARAKVSVRIPGQPKLIVHVDSSSSLYGMCAIAMLENTGDGISMTKHLRYFDGHEACDNAFGFGFDWRRGLKK